MEAICEEIIYGKLNNIPFFALEIETFPKVSKGNLHPTPRQLRLLRFRTGELGLCICALQEKHTACWKS